MTRFKNIRWLAILSWCWLSAYGQPSVLHTGDWYKIAVEKNGVYRISYDLLRKMGVNPSAIDPRRIRMFGLAGGMLPQSNAVHRPHDLPEIAISVTGEADGKFDRNDYILFYAEGPDAFAFDQVRGLFYYENNLYSDRNYYFLTIGPDEGKRLATSENIDGTFPVVSTFNDLAYYENDEYNLERSGRQWFGEKFGTTTAHTISFAFPGISPGSDMTIVSAVLGQSYTDASFRLSLNNAPVAEQKLPVISNGRYSVRALPRTDTITVNAADVDAAGRATQEIRYEFLRGGGFSQAFLDFVLVNVRRDLSLYDGQTIFVSGESLLNEISTFHIGKMTGDARVWDITDHYNAAEQEFGLTEAAATFSATTNVLRKWVAFRDCPEPVFVSKVQNQDLSAIATPNLLIITHPEFRDAADRLAAHRQSFSQWSVHVATTEEIYHQFSGGRQDVTALRDFIRFVRDKAPGNLRAVLLFGKSSYDYKDRLPNNTNFVPTYQSRNSLHPLQTYSSDDYFVFLEADEGSWNESPAEHHTLDAGIGRLPVRTTEEAHNVVDKIIQYDTDKGTLGSWRKKIIFVADDGNSEDSFTSLHQYQADQLATEIEELYPAFDARRIFQGSYKKNVQPNGETAPEMADDIRRAFDLGALIINFTGHGSELVWTDERVLTEKTIEALSNERYPFLVTATCEFGRQDDPLLISTAERSIVKKEGGSIGLVTTARPVNATTNFDLNEAFYAALLQASVNDYPALGEVFMNTKNNSAAGVANRNFSLIGDPSMVLAIPELPIAVTAVTTAAGSDTLRALSTVTVEGEIRNTSGERERSFNGIVEGTLYDKKKEFVTIGKNDPPFAYSQWDNALFRGQASVREGGFRFTFVIPENTATAIGKGKLTLYASDQETGAEAKGVNGDVLIGGIEANVPADITPPSIRLFIGDTTFTDGGVTTPDTYLIVKLEDENGINISGYDSEHNVVGILDGGEATFTLNDYYVSEVDTHRKGTITFPLLGLTPGTHTLTVKAWDVFNNPSETTIRFVVTEGDALLIENFGNFPNPFQDRTTLFFTHNRSGDDLSAQLFIFSLTGELITSAEFSFTESEYHMDLMDLTSADNSGKKLSPGLYLARLIVRSMTNGSKNEKVTKLIVLN